MGLLSSILKCVIMRAVAAKAYGASQLLWQVVLSCGWDGAERGMEVGSRVSPWNRKSTGICTYCRNHNVMIIIPEPF